MERLAPRAHWPHRQHRAGPFDGIALRISDCRAEARPRTNCRGDVARLPARRPARQARLPERPIAPRHPKNLSRWCPPRHSQTPGPPLGIAAPTHPVPSLRTPHAWPTYGLCLSCASLAFRLCSAPIPLLFRQYPACTLASRLPLRTPVPAFILLLSACNIDASVPGNISHAQASRMTPNPAALCNCYFSTAP